MTSNTVVAMCDIIQMCFVGFPIQVEWTAVTESVALFTHCWAVQFCQPSWKTHARIKGCKLFGPNEPKSLFYLWVCDGRSRHTRFLNPLGFKWILDFRLDFWILKWISRFRLKIYDIICYSENAAEIYSWTINEPIPLSLDAHRTQCQRHFTTAAHANSCMQDVLVQLRNLGKMPTKDLMVQRQGSR